MITYGQIKKGMKFIGIPHRGKHKEDKRIFTVIKKKKEGIKRIIWLSCVYLPVRNAEGGFGGYVDLDFTMGEMNHYLRQIPKEIRGAYI